MKKEDDVIVSWLEHLKLIMPPQSITLIGAGNGSGVLAQWILKNIQPQVRVFFAEADSKQFSSLERIVSPQIELDNSIDLFNEVIAPTEEEVSFFFANNKAENGLIRPEFLHTLWPGLKTVDFQQKKTYAFPSMLSNAIDSDGSAFNLSHWLMLDCLPAVSLLQAIEEKLHLIDVILVRVLLDVELDVEDGKLLSIAGLKQVEQLLVRMGMRRVVLKSAHHPAMAQVLFVRDVRLLESRYVEQIEILRNERNLFEKLAKARAIQIKRAQLQTKVNSDIENSLQLERAHHNELKAELQKIQSEKKQLQQLIKQMQDEHEKTIERQQAFQDELSRADSQIKLIRDLFLPEN